MKTINESNISALKEEEKYFLIGYLTNGLDRADTEAQTVMTRILEELLK